MSARPAAAAAAAAAAVSASADDAAVQPGGKRKGGSLIHLNERAKRLKADMAKLKKGYEEKQQELKEDYEEKRQQLEQDYQAELDMIRLRPWVKSRLSGEGDNVECTVEVLRSCISGMKKRPLFEDSEGDKTDYALFLETLEFRPLRPASSPDAKPEDEHDYHFRLITDILENIDGTNLPTVFELVMILRLFVALGGDLNMPLFIVSDSARPMTTSEVVFWQITKIGRVATTLAAWLVHHDSAFLLAVLLAGPSLRIQWEVPCAFLSSSTEPPSCVCTTMFQVAWRALKTVMVDFDLAQLADLGVRRLLSLAGERGAEYVLCFPPFPSGLAKEYLPSSVWPRLVDSEFRTALYREFENDDASAYRYAGDDSTQLHINARRNAYRAGFEPVVHCATLLLRELCAVIAAYAMAPLA